MDESQTSKVIIVVALVAGILVGAGIGYALFNGGDDAETYNFYLYFDEGSDDNGWYSATGADAGDAFCKAMDKAGFEYEINGYGYIESINDEGLFGWGIFQYLYAQHTADAAEASVGYVQTDSYGNLLKSNGWAPIAGYESDDAFKLSQIGSSTYFLSLYGSDWVATSPTDVDDWMSSGPFSA